MYLFQKNIIADNFIKNKKMMDISNFMNYEELVNNIEKETKLEYVTQIKLKLNL